MKMMAKGALLAALAMTAGAAQAAVTFNIQEVGGNVVATGSGAINTTGLTVAATANYSKFINGGNGGVIVGSGLIDSVKYTNAATSFQSFGTTTNFVFASSSTGDEFGLHLADQNSIFLPVGYVSNTALAGALTINGATLASLNLTPGSYLVRLVNGDSITVNVGGVSAPAVPEPATWAMMIAGFGAVGGAMRRRQIARVRFA